MKDYKSLVTFCLAITFSITIPIHLTLAAGGSIDASELRPAADKAATDWDRLTWHVYDLEDLPDDRTGALTKVKALLYPAQYPVTFKETSTLREDRNKFPHGQGVVAKVSWVPTESAKNLSGMLKTGAKNGIVRLSLAIPKHTSSDTLKPGAGFVWYAHNQPAIGIHAMPTVDGYPGDNPFLRPYSTSIPKAQGWSTWALEKSFRLGLWLLGMQDEARPVTPSTLPIYEVAAIDERGLFYGPTQNHVIEGLLPLCNVPAALVFVPRKEVIDASKDGEFRRNLIQNIKAGTILFDIVAASNLAQMESLPPSEQGAKAIHGEVIGYVKLESDFVATRVSDREWHVRHLSHNGPETLFPRWKRYFESTIGEDAPHTSQPQM